MVMKTARIRVNLSGVRNGDSTSIAIMLLWAGMCRVKGTASAV